MSKHVCRLIERFAHLATAPLSRNRRMITLSLVSERLRQSVSVSSEGRMLRFECSTARALHDPLAFHTSEPEMLRWIDNHIEPGDVVWDIGANIGMYTLYAALVPDVRIIAFEPSAATFAALVRNIEINQAGDRISAFCLALSDHTAVDYLHMANTAAGHSMHAFGQLDTVDGRLTPSFSQAVPGFTVDGVHRLLNLPAPDHIKLDVDSIEEKILRGAQQTLTQVRSVVMEVTGESDAAAAAVLYEHGFEIESADDRAARNRIFVKRRT